MAEFVIPAIVSLVVTLIVWFSANFVGQPFIRFYRLRDEAQASLTFYANVSPVGERANPKEHADWERFLEAQGILRRLASELRALAVNHPFIARVLARLGYQLVDAASGLIGFSNTIADPAARRRGELAWNRDKIERSLRFPLTYPEGVKLRDE